MREFQELSLFFHRTSRRRKQVVPKHGPSAGVYFHLHQVQRPVVSSLLLGDSRQPQLYSPILVITLLLCQTPFQDNTLTFFTCSLISSPSFWSSHSFRLSVSCSCSPAELWRVGRLHICRPSVSSPLIKPVFSQCSNHCMGGGGLQYLFWKQILI